MRNLREYLWAKSAREALELRSSRPGRGAFLGGGTVLAARQDPALDWVVDVSQAGLGGIRAHEAGLDLGATVTLEELVQDAEIRSLGSGILGEAARRTRTEPWRRQATLAGRLLEGESTDLLTPCLLVLGARIRVQGSPQAPPDSFDLGDFLERRAARADRPEAADGPLVLGIEIPRPAPGTACALEVVSRSALDAPLAVVAVAIRVAGRAVAGARVATSALPAPRRARRTEAALERSAAGEIEPAIAALADDIAAPNDWRASAEYREHAAGVLLGRALRRAFASPGGG